MSDITGELLQPNDERSLREWREAHAHTFAGFREDPDLPPMSFRTEGHLLFLAPDFYKQCFRNRGEAG